MFTKKTLLTLLFFTLGFITFKPLNAVYTCRDTAVYHRGAVDRRAYRCHDRYNDYRRYPHGYETSSWYSGYAWPWYNKKTVYIEKPVDNLIDYDADYAHYYNDGSYCCSSATCSLYRKNQRNIIKEDLVEEDALDTLKENLEEDTGD